MGLYREDYDNIRKYILALATSLFDEFGTTVAIRISGDGVRYDFRKKRGDTSEVKFVRVPNR